MTHFSAPRLIAGLMLSAVFAGAADLPAPITLHAPRSPNITVDSSGAQIERITLSPAVASPAVALDATVGETWTLSFWIKLKDSPLLQAKDFTPTTPVMLVDFQTGDPKADMQRFIIRVMSGKFSAAEQNAGKWKGLVGYGADATPGTWHFLAYSRTSTEGVFYLNGNIVSRTAGTLPAQSQLRALVFGHFDRTRFSDGVILEPRLYPKALNRDEILDMSRDVPPAAR